VNGRRTGRISSALAIVVIFGALIAAIGVSRSLFERLGRRRPAAGPATAALPESVGGDLGGEVFNVVTSEGEVRVFRAGRWAPVQRGDRLTRDDFVRTEKGARAVLRLTAGSEVELRERVEIRLDRLSAAGASVDLRRGKVVARVSAPHDALAITARETRTSSEGPAHFVVMADDHGQVSVATMKGTTRFASGGKTVEVPEGTATHSGPGQPPSDPERIPEEVLLQVVWPAGEKHGDTTSVQGRVAPAATVTVNGAPAAVAPDGRFSAEVPLGEGPNQIDVVTEDLAGRTKHESATVTKRTRAPKLTPEPAELWKK
jgi:hypothetical protein